jgi:hypothetical protein
MKLGIVLPSYMYNDVRRELVDSALWSLARTEPLMESTRLLLLVKSGRVQEYTPYLEALRYKFSVVVKTDEGLNGTEHTLAFGTQWMLDNYDVDYITWMGDDALFHFMWLWKLKGLIERHPEAKSWSVYRSSYEWVHKTLQETEEDAMARSICGHGMTFSRKEWEEWGVRWEQGAWCAPDGDTLDLCHVAARSGERWVTKQSYVQHTAPHAGTHCTPLTPEYAKDFVGI